ncbi:MAG: hypothetical protein AABX61_01255 [Nanoarchaeota archaeon]
MLEHKFDSDYINEFAHLRIGIINAEKGIARFDILLKFLQKSPICTYEERGKVYGYDLKIADKETLLKLNKYANEVNEKVKNNDLTIDKLKEIINEVYLIFYKKKAFD